MAVDQPATLNESAVDPWLSIRTGLDEPVRLRAFASGEFPRENLILKLDGALGHFGVNLKMNDSVHARFFL